MLQCNLKKWSEQLTRAVEKMEPWRRKQYRKARYRKQTARFEKFSKRELEQKG